MAAKKTTTKKTTAKAKAKPAAVEEPALTEVDVLGDGAQIVGDPGDAGEDAGKRPLTDIDPKVAAGTGSGAAGIVLLWVLSEYFSVNPPELVQGAIIVLLGFIGGYLKKNAAS